MARDSTFDERRRQRELEDQQEAQDKAAQANRKATGGALQRGTGDPEIDKLIELLTRAEPMIEQVNNLYNQYLAGIEARPPLERRKQLEQVMTTLQLMNKPTPAYQFRYSSLNMSYSSHRDRWDRLAKDLEAGRIKRAAGPRRPG